MRPKPNACSSKPNSRRSKRPSRPKSKPAPSTRDLQAAHPDSRCYKREFVLIRRTPQDEILRRTTHIPTYPHTHRRTFSHTPTLPHLFYLFLPTVVSSGPTNGRRAMKREPRPTTLSARRLPPCASRISLEIVSPSPTPARRARDLSTW